MDIDLAVIADAANVSQEGKLNILGIFDTIWTREFPFRHPTMVFVVRVSAGPTDRGSHRLDVRLLDTNGSQLFKAEGPLQVAAREPGRTVKPHVVMGLNGIMFHGAGDYAFEVRVDDRHLRTVPLHVMQTPKTPPERMA